MPSAARSSWVIVGLMLAALVLAGASWADTAPRVLELLAESQELVKADDMPGALAKLDEAARIAPDHPGVYANLGFLHGRQGDTLAALDAYAKLLTLRPDDEYGRSRMTHIYFGGTFPRRLRMSLLHFSPLSFVTDECKLRMPGAIAEVTRRIASTSGMLYPDEMGDDGGPIVMDIPSAGGQGTVGRWMGNTEMCGHGG